MKDAPNLVRDQQTGAILNFAPASGLMKRRQRAAESEERLTNLESEMTQIKGMLSAILRKLNDGN